VGDADGVVDRDGEAVDRRLRERTAAGAGAVHADDDTVAVHERSAGVAGLDRGVDLDQAVQRLGVRAIVVGGGDRLIERNDRARRRGRCAASPQGVPEGEDGIADGELTDVTGCHGGQTRHAVDLEQSHVVGGVVAEDAGGVRRALAVDLDTDVGGAVDHVVVGQDLPRRGEHHPGPGRRPVRQGGVDVDDGRIDLRGDGGDVEAASGDRSGR
jgi:hypothetical protein